MTATAAWLAWAAACIILGALWQGAWVKSAGLPSERKWRMLIRIGVALTVVGMTLFGIVIGVMA